MALGTLTGLFQNRNNSGKISDRGVPLFNTIALPFSGSPYSRQTQIQKKKRFMNWYKNYSPELTAMVNMVVRDVAEESYFESVNKKDNGRNKVLAAEKFATNNFLSQKDISVITDIIVTGEGYDWMAKLDGGKLSKEVDKFMRSKDLPVHLKSLFLKANNIDETKYGLRKFRYVASSMVENVFDDTNINGYVQKSGVNERHFRFDEIIHYRFYDIDGLVSGFTPLEGLMLQLEVLHFMWRNMKAMSKNGGQMDKIYSVEDLDVNSQNFKRIEKELKKYYGVDERHGSLLVNGKINVQDIQQMDSMQFKDAGQYVTGLVAMQWSIPQSRYPIGMKESGSKSDLGGGSEKNYWSNIEKFQDLYLAMQNKFLWIPYFGVVRKFKKAYKHDEVMENQAEQLRLNNLTFTEDNLRKRKKQLTQDYVIRYLNGAKEPIREEDLEDVEEEPMDENNPLFRQNLLRNDEAARSTENNNVNAQRRSEANSKKPVKGTPAGVVKQQRNVDVVDRENKESDDALEFKGLVGSSVMEVSFMEFIRLYNEDKAFNKEPPRVFISENDGIAKLVYRSTDFTYRSETPTTMLTPTKLMNFRKTIVVDVSDMEELAGTMIVSDNDEVSEE
jgi:hypothetical protein